VVFLAQSAEKTYKCNRLLGTCNYLLYIIPRNKPDSGGIDFVNLSFLEYSYSFTKKISAFINSSFYLKSGKSQRSTDVVAVAYRGIIGVQWTFLDKES
jgi:hypothetical protein